MPETSMQGHQSRYVFSVMCEDKLGLVAKLTGAVRDLGGNIEQLHQSVLQGYFVFTMIASFTEEKPGEGIRKSLEGLERPGEFVVSVLPQRQDVPPAAVGETFILTIEGNDSPGVLTRITSYLADRKINIEDVASKTREDLFLITAQLTIPEAVDVRCMRLDLTEILSDNGATVSLMHRDIFAATNRVTM